MMGVVFDFLGSSAMIFITEEKKLKPQKQFLNALD